MFHCRTDMIALNTTNHCRCKLSCKEWVLRIILKIPTTKRTAMNIDSRSKPHCNIVLLNFRTASFSNLFYQFLIPRTCKLCRTRPCRCIHTALWRNTQASRTIRSHNIWNPIIRQISPAKCICNACVWLSTQQMRKLLIRQLCHKFIQRNCPLCHFF